MTPQSEPFFIKRHAIIAAVLMVSILAQSCVSNIVSQFGRTKFTVSTNVANPTITKSKLGNTPKKIETQGKKASFNVRTRNYTTICLSKAGHQTESLVVFPDAKNKTLRRIDLALGILGLLSSYSANPAAIGLGAYGGIHLYNVIAPYPGWQGNYGKFKNPRAIIDLYPDSLANPQRFDIACDKFNINLKKDQELGSFYRFGTKHDSYKMKDSVDASAVEFVYDVNTQLSKLHLLRTREAIAKTKSIFDQDVNPKYILRADVKTISIDAHTSNQSYFEDDVIFVSSLKVEWKVYDKLERLLFTKTIESKGQRISVYDKEKETTDKGVNLSIDDAVRRSVNQLVFSKEFIRYVQKSKDIDKNGIYENYTESLVIAKPKAITNPKVLAEASNSVVTLIRKESHGSGSIISQDGYILTNAHVCGSDTAITVRFKSGEETTATLVRMNLEEDLALLKFDNKNKLPGLVLMKDNSDVSVSDEIYVVGTPTDLSLGQSISKGLISGERSIKKKKLYQTDAAINGGNSGGAMLDKKGNVIGIPSSKIRGTGLEGLGFAIPSAVVFDALKISY